MKEIEKLAEDFVEIRRQEIFNEESQPTDPAWFIPVYEAGFLKAREMAANVCTPLCDWNKTADQIQKKIEKLGESEF
jgi:hypothetical protein